MKNDAMISDNSAVSDDSSNYTPARKNHRPIVTLDADIFSDVDVNLCAILGRGTIAVRALLDLSEGSILDLDTPLDGTIDLVLNDRVIAQGEIVAVEDKFGVRITKIVADRR
jgi:flagellar motor switch protein FliN